jgi:hypothetical protein
MQKSIAKQLGRGSYLEGGYRETGRSLAQQAEVDGAFVPAHHSIQDFILTERCHFRAQLRAQPLVEIAMERPASIPF